MYLGIDIGGTKTLIATFDAAGSIVSQKKIPTDPDYNIFLKDLENYVAEIATNKIIACCVAVPGLIDREEGIIHALGNLDWKDKHIKSDMLEMVGDAPVFLENDSRLAGLAEANALLGIYSRVVFMTVSTGIGGALVIDGKIVKELEDTEFGKMPLVFNGQVTNWEDFASGRGIVNKFGKRASEIEDPKDWEEIGSNLASGVGVLCAFLQPEVIVFGGGVGQYAEKFTGYISVYLKNNLHAVIRQPKALLAPHYAENSVIHGCFELLKQKGLIQ